MFCSQCGKEIGDNQFYCPNCGAKCKDEQKPAHDKREKVEVAANVIQRAYNLTLLASVALSIFWLILYNGRNLKDYLWIAFVVEFSVIFLAIFLLTLNQIYKYNESKIVMLSAALTTGEIIVLLLNTKSVIIFLSVKAITASYFILTSKLLKKGIEVMIANSGKKINKPFNIQYQGKLHKIDPSNSMNATEPAPISKVEESADGVWTCPSCQKRNLASRDTCWSCGTQKHI